MFNLNKNKTKHEQEVLKKLDKMDRKCYQSYLDNISETTLLQRKEKEIKDFLENKTGLRLKIELKALSDMKFPAFYLKIYGDIKHNIVGTNMQNVEEKVIIFIRRIKGEK
jgi:DNA polymerase III alpha subunit